MYYISDKKSLGYFNNSFFNIAVGGGGGGGGQKVKICAAKE